MLIAEAQTTQRAGRGAAARRRPRRLRTPWGNPDLQGAFTNSDESLIPMERPDALAGKTLDRHQPRSWHDSTSSATRPASRPTSSDGSSEARCTGSRTTTRRTAAPGSSSIRRTARIPPTTAEAKQRASPRAAARQGRGEADSWEDRSLYDRCISRGLPGSMMPAIYGNSYQIIQGPGFVAIGYEMVNEMRVIPLDGRPHVGVVDSHATWAMRAATSRATHSSSRQRTSTAGRRIRGSSEKLRLIERFKPTAPKIVEWSVTLDDAATWTRPWTFAMNLTKVDEPPFEYACHEGNYAMRNILGIARQQEAEEAAKKAGGAAR